MNVQQSVSTIISVSSAGFSAQMSAVQSAAGAAGQAISGLTGMLGPLTAALSAGALVGVGKQLLNIGSEFENAQNTIAGFLSALGVTSDFNNGLKMASKTMNQIIVDSAKLPGEAEQYIEVFKSGLPVVRAASGGTLKDITAFTNRFTAVMTTFGVGAEEAGIELQRMLAAGHGTAIIRSPGFRSLVTFMHQLPGQANLTAESFNKMTEAKRFQVLTDTMKMLQPMLDNASGSWEAQTGALASNVRMVGRLASAPYFEYAKKALAKINALFMDEDGNLTQFSKNLEVGGQLLSKWFISGFEKLTDILSVVGEHFQGILSIVTKLYGMKLIGGAMDIAGRAMGNLGYRAQQMMGGETGQNTSAAMASTFNIAAQRLNAFMTLLQPAGNLILDAADAFLDMWAAVGPPIQEAANEIIVPLISFARGVMLAVDVLYNRLKPTIHEFWLSVGRMVTAVGSVLGPIIRILAQAMGFMYKRVIGVLGPVIELIIKGMTQWYNWIAAFLEKIGKHLDALAPPKDVQEEGANWFDEFMKAFDSVKDAQEDADKAANAIEDAGKGTPAGPGVYQDFRGSRFDITQKFAEGYDPDRIAIAFADDVGNMGMTKIQSGFTPIFSR